MEEWKEYNLGELIELNNGFAFKSKDFVTSGIPVIKIRNVKANRISLEDVSYVSMETALNIKCTPIMPSDILITMTGNRKDGSIDSWVGKVALFNHEGLYLLNQRVSAIRIKHPNIVDYRYLAYFLSSFESQLYFINHSNSSGGQANISPEIVNNYIVNLPSLQTQKRISNLLKTFDDKIELNRRINRNLEQQAQALFKAWFVDFEPFKNGKFVDSEFGRIPEGWNIVEANHFMTISKDSINPTKNPMCLYTHYSIPAFDEALTPEIQFGHKIKSNKFLVRSGMTLFSKLNPRIKRIWFINEASDNSICSTEFIPYESLGQNCYFLYCYLNSNMFYSQAMSLVNGATGSHQRFSPNETLKFLFAYKKEIVEEFNVLVAPTLKEMSELSLETRKIAKLRDTLLPRLMSGELNINTITE